MQLAAVFVQQKWHWYAPAALARNTPVGPVGNHVAQTGFAVFRVELGLLNRIQRQLAQRFGRFVFGEHAFALVHAHKPLRRRTVNDRRFVPPAMRVAVGDALGGHQAPGVFQSFQNLRYGFPDVLTTKQGEVGGISAIALHRVQDGVIGQALGDAGVKVFHAIGRRGVHDAGAVCICSVVCQIHRRGAGVAGVDVGQGVMKGDMVQRLAFYRRHDRALQLPAFQAFVHQRLRAQHQAARGVHQGINQGRIEVERLVGRNRPGGSGPNDGKSFFVQLGQPKSLGQFVRLGT